MSEDALFQYFDLVLQCCNFGRVQIYSFITERL